LQYAKILRMPAEWESESLKLGLTAISRIPAHQKVTQVVKTPFGIVGLLAVIAQGHFFVAHVALLQGRPAPIKHGTRVVD
jgi:hypothetical protein